MSLPEGLKFTKSHEWARIEGEICTTGITDFAVEELNREIVNVDLPEVGGSVKQNENFGILDAVKAAFDLYSPLSGKIVEVNQAVLDDPTVVATGPFTEGWMIKIKIADPKEVDNLLDMEAYRQLLESETKE